MAAQYNRDSFSAPATLERQKTRTNWFTNAKAVFTRPWKLRSQRRARKRRNPARPIPPPGSASLTSLKEDQPLQQEFPNFSRLSPLGGRPQSGGRKEMSASKENKDDLKIPEYPQPSRPPLSNIFPMYNSPEVKVPEINTPERSVKEQRRHSTPTTPNSLLVASIPGDRRQSASSDTSMDKNRIERRVRRASVTRDLPSLPKRGQDPLQGPRPGSVPTPKLTLVPNFKPISAPVSPYSEYTPFSDNRSLQRADSDQPDSGEQLVLDFGAGNRPPVAPGGLQSNFSYPPSWLQLQELEEELEEDGEGDGEEEGITRVDELTQEGDGGEQKYAPAPHEHPRPPGPGKSKEGGGKFGRKLLSIMSSKTPVKAEGGATKAKEPSGGEKEEDPDIKGFDDFFMY